jgi:hypothetical protein
MAAAAGSCGVLAMASTNYHPPQHPHPPGCRPRRRPVDVPTSEGHFVRIHTLSCLHRERRPPCHRNPPRPPRNRCRISRSTLRTNTPPAASGTSPSVGGNAARQASPRRRRPGPAHSRVQLRNRGQPNRSLRTDRPRAKCPPPCRTELLENAAWGRAVSAPWTRRPRTH